MQKPFSLPDAIAPSLIFTTDEMPGYHLVRRGHGFSYRLPEGGFLKNTLERRRIASLAIPPAYEAVWIRPVENGHLQAAGIDFRERKQYRYHPDRFEYAADRKFSLLTGFAASLPGEACRRALAEPALSRERVVAGIVALLDRTGYRIGNSRYEKENRSFGLSSLHTRHVRLDENHFLMRFPGKSGMAHKTEVADRAVLELVLKLQDLPGQHLFRYESDGGGCHDVDSSEVNGWIREASGGDYSAKQFRTWKAIVRCALELKKMHPPETKAATRRVITAAIKSTAAQLHHTTATCRKYYIHPVLFHAYEDGSLHRIMLAPPPLLRKNDGSAYLYATERRVYKIINR